MAVNETVVAIAAGKTMFELVISRFEELITAPYFYSELLWITIPLVVALIFMDLYFGRYKEEELGWNTAVGNAMALVFVTMDLIRQLFTKLVEPSFGNLILTNFKGVLVVFVLGLGSLWLFLANFFHILPKRLAFFISSSLPTSVFAYLAIILIYTDIPLDRYTFIAGFVLFIVLLVILEIIQFIIPAYKSGQGISQVLRKKEEL